MDQMRSRKTVVLDSLPCFRKPMITDPLRSRTGDRMTPRQDTDTEHDTPSPSLPLPTVTPSSPEEQPPKPPKLRRPLSCNAAEFHPASSPPSQSLIRPSLELVPPKRSPTVDSLLSALTPDEPRELKEEDTDELWAKLRCGSLRTEEVAEREKQKQDRLAKRQNRCADYPGLAFGSAMFGSDTTMRFNIIKNELHNIMRSQLKRVDGEVNALSSRVKKLDNALEESERLIRTATAALSECVNLQIEESKTRSQETESESHLSAFDQHILYLETQLKDAKIKASHNLQIMEDCDKAQEHLFLQPPATSFTSLIPKPLKTSCDPLPPADNSPPSSNPSTDPVNNLNNNNNNNNIVVETICNGVNNNYNSRATITNNLFENQNETEANNNNNLSVNQSEVSIDFEREENGNCLHTLLSEEDSANGNTRPLPM